MLTLPCLAYYTLLCVRDRVFVGCKEHDYVSVCGMQRALLCVCLWDAKSLIMCVCVMLRVYLFVNLLDAM